MFRIVAYVGDIALYTPTYSHVGDAKRNLEHLRDRRVSAGIQTLVNGKWTLVRSC